MPFLRQFIHCFITHTHSWAVGQYHPRLPLGDRPPRLSEKAKPRASLVERLALVFTVPRCVLEDPRGLSLRERTEKQII